MKKKIALWLLSVSLLGYCIVYSQKKEDTKPLVLYSSDYISFSEEYIDIATGALTSGRSLWWKIVASEQGTKGALPSKSFPREVQSGDLILLEQIVLPGGIFVGSKNFLVQDHVPVVPGTFTIYRSFTILFTGADKRKFLLSIKKGRDKEFFVSNNVVSGKMGLTADKSKAYLFSIEDHYSSVQRVKELDGEGYIHLVKTPESMLFEKYYYQATAFQDKYKLYFSQMTKPKEDGPVNYLGRRDPSKFLFNLYDDGCVGIVDESGRNLVFATNENDEKIVCFKKVSEDIKEYIFWEIIPFASFRKMGDRRAFVLKNKKLGLYLTIENGSDATLTSNLSNGIALFVLSNELVKENVLNKKGPSEWFDSYRNTMQPSYHLEDREHLVPNTISLDRGDWIELGIKEFNIWFQLQFAEKVNKEDSGKLLQVRFMNKMKGEVVACEQYGDNDSQFIMYNHFTMNNENLDPENKGKFLFSLSVNKGEVELYAKIIDIPRCEPGIMGLCLLLTPNKEDATIFGITRYFSPRSYLSELGEKGYLSSDSWGKTLDLSNLEGSLDHKLSSDGSEKSRDLWDVFNFSYALSAAQIPVFSIQDAEGNYLHYHKKKDEERLDLIFGPLKNEADRYWQVWPSEVKHNNQVGKIEWDSKVIELVHDATGKKLEERIVVDQQKKVDEKSKKVSIALIRNLVNTFKLEPHFPAVSTQKSLLDEYIGEILGEGNIFGISPAGREILIKTEQGKLFTILPGTEKGLVQIKINNHYLTLSDDGSLVVRSEEDLADEKRRDWSLVVDAKSRSAWLFYEHTKRMLFIRDKENATAYTRFRFAHKPK